PLTVSEVEDCVNRKVREHHEYMKTCCPHPNLAPRRCPAILVRTALNDSQVMYREPARWVAKLRTFKTYDRPLFLKVNLDSGHGGASGRYDALRELAFDYAFILTRLERAS